MKLNPALIHSIDKFETAAKINDILANSGRIQEILIQVNTSNEDSKSGVRSTETIELIKRISRLANVRIKGLMTIGAFTTDQENIRNCFRILRKLFDQIKKMGIKNVDMRYLSMGMTGDFEIAIEEGANIIRIGSAIFGAREH
ncbi:MAG: YggS family pyridoxal phosphate-dependent enzyme [Candidatus Cloacimonetes bacterium]|nr:YggS family pyridoxal phosphate-dependent enzyme [Candidatus Cloacimonadota bacterium]